MKLEKLVKILEAVVRRVVQSENKRLKLEIKKANENLLKEIDEKLAEYNLLTESNVKQPNKKRASSLMDVVDRSDDIEEKPISKKFSNNSTLNQVLNEVHSEGEWRNLKSTSGDRRVFTTDDVHSVGGGAFNRSDAPSDFALTDPDGRPIRKTAEVDKVMAKLANPDRIKQILQASREKDGKK